MGDEIRHEDDGRNGGFYLERDGVQIGELTYRHAGKGVVVFHHTEVDPALRGRGIARKLLDAGVNWVRQNQLRIEPSCPYVKAQFARDPSIHDTLAGQQDAGGHQDG